MILCVLENESQAENLLKSGAYLALKLDKQWGILSFNEISNIKINYEKSPFLNEKANFSFNKLAEYCENNDVSFLLIQLNTNKSSEIKNKLKACRDLRIPYLFFKNNYQELQMDKVIVPVNFLEEEIEKAQFAAAFGRFCQSKIQLLQAKDFGSKAEKNVKRMIELFKKFEFEYSISMATKDSFGVDAESISVAQNENAGLVIISASRDYGLDDIIFGPKEQHIIRKSQIPVLLVNPRGDLYALCD